jgi:hypothetical protein
MAGLWHRGGDFTHSTGRDGNRIWAGGSEGDEAGGRGAESATPEVEGPQVLLEVDVQPCAACPACPLDGEGDQPGAGALPVHPGGDHGVEDEGVGATVPGHVDEPGEIIPFRVQTQPKLSRST